ncbi:MAG: DUF3098 domain-containing protein [Bacteroidales bacterium]|nr:DUF3098 domain-containing protein [Bacteroidales bacterium]
MEKDNKNEKQMPFGRDNYKWVIIGMLFLLVGFLLMIGGGSNNPNEFNPDIFSARRITFAPILVLIGFGIQIYAILKKNDKR